MHAVIVKRSTSSSSSSSLPKPGRFRMSPLLGLALLSLAAAPVLAAGSSASTCDRDCLRDVMTQYLTAMVAHRPESVPVAAKVRITENSIVQQLGDGLWKTISKLGPFRQDILDVKQGVAGSYLTVEEDGKLVMLTVRLKVAGRKIQEIETQATHNKSEVAVFQPESLREATASMNVPPAPSKRETRDELIRVAAFYPAGLKAGGFTAVPFASDAYRVENGRRMAGKGCEYLPPSCEDPKAQKLLRGASSVSYRVAAVDEELGIVWLRVNFANRFPDGTSGVAWEAFKISGGEIHAVEIFMRNLPNDGDSGWDSHYPSLKP